MSIPKEFNLKLGYAYSNANLLDFERGGHYGYLKRDENGNDTEKNKIAFPYVSVMQQACENLYKTTLSLSTSTSVYNLCASFVDATKKLIALNEERNALQKHICEQNLRSTEQTSNIIVLNTQLSKKDKKISKLSQQLNSHIEQIKIQNEQLNTSHETNAKINEELHSNQKSEVTLKGQFALLQEQYRQSQNIIEEQNAKIKQLEQEKALLQQQNSASNPNESTVLLRQLLLKMNHQENSLSQLLNHFVPSDSEGE